MQFVERLKSTVDIVKVIGEYVRLRRQSPARYVGLCPFHSEKNPSFSVHATHQFYKCFSCGAGGDVIKFVMEMEQLSFPEALQLLADRNGIPMPRRAEFADPDSKRRAALADIHETAARAFRETLLGPMGVEARAYLDRRGVKAETAEQFGLGLADRGGQSLLRRLEKAGYPAADIEASGLVSKRADGSGFYDRFRGRLIFPIHNESGKVIAFGGRALAPGDEPKYLNSPETAVYRKSYTLYNLHRAKQAIRKAGRAVLVEGYMDVVGVWAGGVQEVVASCGTALTSEQVRAVKRHSDRIVVNFDPDPAGTAAAERSIQMLLDEGMHVRVLELEGGLDPDEYVKDRGADAYRARLDHAAGYFLWLADRARAKVDMRTAEGRVDAFRSLLPAIQRMSDKIERLALANEVSAYLGIEPGAVLEQFRKNAAERRDTAPAGAGRPDVRPVERLLLRAILTQPNNGGGILDRLRGISALERFRTRGIFSALLAMRASGSPLTLNELDGRLDKDEKALLSGLLLADELDEELSAPEHSEACLRTLEAADRQEETARLKARIREAERAGDMQEAMRLTGQLNSLLRG